MQDYSAHGINAQKRLKEADRLLLKNKYAEAVIEIDEAIVALRMKKAAINHLKEEHETRHRI